MSNTTISVLVRYWYDLQTDTTRLQMIRTDTSEAVHLGDNSFLLYFPVDEETSVVRCLIRHVASGREGYVQGGPNLHAFIKTCLLNTGESEHSDSGTTEM